MTSPIELSLYSLEVFKQEASDILSLLQACVDIRAARFALFARVSACQFQSTETAANLTTDQRIMVRDCARAWRGIIKEHGDSDIGFSVIEALFDIANDRPRPDLQPGFFAEMIHLVQGIEGRAILKMPDDLGYPEGLSGRDAAIARSDLLDKLWSQVSGTMDRYQDGLSADALTRRQDRIAHILKTLGAQPEDWADWKWQARHVIKSPDTLASLVHLRDWELDAVREARAHHLPFGVTPYYASLMDDDPEQGRDRAIRAQVLPPPNYVKEMARHLEDRSYAFDFMLERDTSPIDLITRRYPAIVIFKPFNTCPQICVYCQRNWEIKDAMVADALAPSERMEAAFQWIEQHPQIREVLVTGGDPLTLEDSILERILTRLSIIPSIEIIRLGSRIPVTIPMRITESLASLLGSFREPGRRELLVTTHVEHPYEVTPDLITAVERLRSKGIAVYNQLVFTFFVSRRFEAARLRMLLRRINIDPYYTFAPKGKEETSAYRVPIARLLQEQNEEARLLPGMRRTDEIVYNLPGIGKNYLRAVQHRDVVSVLPDGARVYEFHPWEKGVMRKGTYVGKDIPILEYLTRLAALGESPEDYSSIWYYF